MSPWQGQPASSSEGLDGLASRPHPRGTAARWQDKPPSSARDRLSITCSCMRAPHVSSSLSSADPDRDFGVSCRRCLGVEKGSGVQSQPGYFGELLSAYWCKPASKGCVFHHEQAPGGMWSPSGHVPSNFNPLLEVESTAWRRAIDKELPSPCLGEQCFHAVSMEKPSSPDLRWVFCRTQPWAGKGAGAAQMLHRR